MTTALHYFSAMELGYSELHLFQLPVIPPFFSLLFPFFLLFHLNPAYYPLALSFPSSLSPLLSASVICHPSHQSVYCYHFCLLHPIYSCLLFISHSISRLLPVPAMITSHPNTTMAKKGHLKELNCTARGEWPIIIRWERGDTVIDPDRNPRYSITTSPNEKTDEVLSTLKVKKKRRLIYSRRSRSFLMKWDINVSPTLIQLTDAWALNLFFWFTFSHPDYYPEFFNILPDSIVRVNTNDRLHLDIKRSLSS